MLALSMLALRNVVRNGSRRRRTVEHTTYLSLRVASSTVTTLSSTGTSSSAGEREWQWVTTYVLKAFERWLGQ
jgi:hypothetical protein